MLCQLCSSIDLDQLTTQEGYQHHSSWADLKASAKSGCPFCTAISSSFSSQPFLPLPDRIELSKGVKFRARYWISLINKAGIKDIDVINLESNRIEEFLVFTTPGIIIKNAQKKNSNCNKMIPWLLWFLADPIRRA